MYSEKLSLRDYSSFEDDVSRRKSDSEDYSYRNQRHNNEKSHSWHLFSSSDYRDSLKRLQDFDCYRQTHPNRRFSSERMQYSKSDSYRSLSRSRSPSCGARDHLYKTYTREDKRLYICHACRENDKEQSPKRDHPQIKLDHFEEFENSSFTKRDEQVLDIKYEKFHHQEREDEKKQKNKTSSIFDFDNELHIKEKKQKNKASVTIIDLDKELQTSKSAKQQKNEISSISDFDKELHLKKNKRKNKRSVTIIDLDKEFETSKSNAKQKSKVPVTVIDLDNELQTSKSIAKKQKNTAPVTIIDLDKEVQTSKSSVKVEVKPELVTEKKLHSKKEKKIRKHLKKSESKHACKQHKTERRIAKKKKKSITDIEMVAVETTKPYAIEAKETVCPITIKETPSKKYKIEESCSQNKEQHKHVVQDHESMDVLEISVDENEFNEFIIKEGISIEMESNVQQNMRTDHGASNVPVLSKDKFKKLEDLRKIQKARMKAIISMIEKVASSPKIKQNISFENQKDSLEHKISSKVNSSNNVSSSPVASQQKDHTLKHNVSSDTFIFSKVATTNEKCAADFKVKKSDI